MRGRCFLASTYRKNKQNLKEFWHEVKTVGTATRLRITLNISEKVYT